ncbi:MAG: methyltransferase domain-containing protein [Nitrospirae bacterium]|nr:methyltransferase domain-containing protein [Nitrospirota bacterium]MBF0535958.1 methyltransferase domain-containing protein [Nitrospirota bacterium]MBF0618066.1 methyltransferase domain-containing protein [Nitrospirota bacterium]
MKNVLKTLSFNTFIPFFYPALMLPLRPWRKKAIGMLNFKEGDRVLVPGVGSGHDLPFIPDNVDVDGIDISDVMLGIGKLKTKAFRYGHNTMLHKMDAEDLKFDSNSFDKAILSLFLTVVFDPRKAMAEIVRVVRPGGEILVFDHLFRSGAVPSTVAKRVDSVLSYSFASVTRMIDDIIEGLPVKIVDVKEGDPVGFIKGFLLVKNSK